MKRALQFIAEGQYSRALEALVSEGVAPVTQETLKVLREKHPQTLIPELCPHPDEEALKRSSEQLGKSLKFIQKRFGTQTIGSSK